MRKRTKKKKGGGCALCKPHKHKKSGKFEGKRGEEERLREFEKTKREVEG